jgi:type VI secretion system protein ImpJ
MSRALDLPAAVQWYEGMLLAPQHFQQLAQRQEELLHYRTGLASPYAWGVQSIRIDPVLVGQGVLRVLELEGVMPDGLVVSHGPGDADLQMDLRPHLEEAKRGALRVHLVVPADKRSGTRADGDLARYVSSTEAQAADENTGEIIPVAVIQPRLRLLAGDAPARYTALPLLAVRAEGDAFVLDEYAPPAPSIQPGSPIARLCEEVVVRLREKAMYLLETIDNAVAVSQTPIVEHGERILPHLVAGLPAFEAVLRSGRPSPFALHVALAGLAGHVALLGVHPLPPTFSPYDHADPRRGLRELSSFILRTVDEGVSEAYLLVPLELDREVFRVRVDPAWLTRELVLGVLGQPGTTEKQVTDWMAAARIASEGRILNMREMRILGAGRARVDRRQGLVPKRGMRLFSLQADPAFLSPNDTLIIENAAEWPVAPPPAQIFLYVRMKD